MLRKGGILIAMMFVAGFICPLRGEDDLPVRPWWVMAEFGAGHLQLTSRQTPGTPMARFAMGFAGGHSLGSHARIGLELNGWLMEPSSLNDPTRGISVSNTTAVVDVFPIRKLPLFLRGGTGAGVYQNNHPDADGGKGWCWTAGAGYELGLRKHFRLVPMVAYSSGALGDAQSVPAVQSGRRYSVVEFKIGILAGWGKPRRPKETVAQGLLR